MTANKPVDPRVRLAISQWPDDAPRGAVSTFCLEHDISRKAFYAIKARVQAEGAAAALEPRPRRPKTSPSRLTDDLRRQAIGVRAALEASGLDHGPISVHEKMRSLGMTPVPSIASLARIFREAGVARVEPNKKPRAAYRRFVYPSPNGCWQIDATEYVLTGGRKCAIFQLIDDHSRLAVASHVAWAETSEGAIAVVKKGIEAHGVPQRLLSDNGVALNPSRRGIVGQLVAYVTGLGVEAITGKPYKPTTQGKNERFHQTLFRFLDKQPLADSLHELQDQVDTFDHIYNTERPHQGLPGFITPEAAWLATAKAEPPRPRPIPELLTPPAARHELAGPPVATNDTIRISRVEQGGGIRVDGVRYQIGADRAGEPIHVMSEIDTVTFIDSAGTVILKQPKPAPGITYVSNGRPRGRQPRTVTDVLTHKVSPKS